MTAEVIPIRADDPEQHLIDYCCNAVKRGELIAIPTDTLYCLAADPLNLAAVQKVFAAKSRAWDRSLPLIVDSIEQAEELAHNLPSQFYLLARRYWPGKVSLIVEASAAVPLKVTGNTGRLSLRQSGSSVARTLLARLGTPLVATSANVSGHPACSTAAEVLSTLGKHVSVIVDSPVDVGHIDDQREVATTIDLTNAQMAAHPRRRYRRAGTAGVFGRVGGEGAREAEETRDARRFSCLLCLICFLCLLKKRGLKRA